MEAGEFTVPDSNNPHIGKRAPHSHKHGSERLVTAKTRKNTLEGTFLQKEGVKVKATTTDNRKDYTRKVKVKTETKTIASTKRKILKVRVEPNTKT